MNSLKYFLLLACLLAFSCSSKPNGSANSTSNPNPPTNATSDFTPDKIASDLNGMALNGVRVSQTNGKDNWRFSQTDPKNITIRQQRIAQDNAFIEIYIITGSSSEGTKKLRGTIQLFYVRNSGKAAFEGKVAMWELSGVGNDSPDDPAVISD